MYRFGTIVDEVAPEIGTGFSANSDKARRIIRQAITQIIESNPILLHKVVRLYAVGDMLVLPREVRRVQKYVLNGYSERPQHSFFEFIDNGPGLNQNTWQSHNVMTDRGFTPVIYQPSAELQIQILSDRDEDELVCHVRGRTASDKEVRSQNGTVGESIQITEGNTLVESWASFNTITSFTKGRSKGYVHLYSYDPVTDARYLLAKYAPDEEVAAFRQYRLPGLNFKADVADINTVDALVILHQPRYFNDDDIVPLRNSLSIQMIARSIYMGNQMKYKEAQVESQNGMAIARQSIALDYPQGGMPDIDADDFTFGGVETL